MVIRRKDGQYEGPSSKSEAPPTLQLHLGDPFAGDGVFDHLSNGTFSTVMAADQTTDTASIAADSCLTGISTADSLVVLTPTTESFVALPTTSAERDGHEGDQPSKDHESKAQEVALPVNPLSPEEKTAAQEYVKNFTCVNPRHMDKLTPEIHIKALMLGHSGVGMETFGLRFDQDGWFVRGYDPTLMDWYGIRKHLSFEERRVYLDMKAEYPSVPNDAFHAPSFPYYDEARHIEALFLFYDVTSRQSFEAAKLYHRNFHLERSQSSNRCCEGGCTPRPPFQGLTFLCANKIDCRRFDWQVPLDEGRQFAREIGPLAQFAPMSARTGEGCQSIDVREMIWRILLRRTEDPAFFEERASRVKRRIESLPPPYRERYKAYHDSQLYLY